MKFFTQSGYFLLVKSFTDDKSWQIQRDLIKCYFIVKSQAKHGSNKGQWNKFDNEYQSLKKQRMLLDERNKFEKAVQKELNKIISGSKSINDYSEMPLVKEKLNELLNQKPDCNKPDNEIIYRLDMLVNEYKSLQDFSNIFNIKVKTTTNQLNELDEISFIASTRDLFQAFNWLNKKYVEKNPFKNTRVLGSKLSQIDWFHTNWKFERNIKMIHGDRKHLFTKSLSNNSLL